MRVIAGSAKGTKLAAPSQVELRPTTDRAKQIIFDTLYSLVPMPWLVVDLFAGSGALGIEALSRGAKQAIFVEKSAIALKYLNRNLEKTHLRSKARVILTDAFIFLKQERTRNIELAFADPPYGSTDAPKLLALFANSAIFRKGAILILEESAKFTPALEDGTELLSEKRVGDTGLFFIQKKRSGA